MSPLSNGEGQAVLTVSDHVEYEQIDRLKVWRGARDAGAVKAALGQLKAAALAGRDIMESSIACAKAGVTTGEWGETLRSLFGEYRAPTGVSLTIAASSAQSLEEVKAALAASYNFV